MTKRALLLTVVAVSSFVGGAVCQCLVADRARAGTEGPASSALGQKPTAHVNEGDATFVYANAFRVNATAEEMLLDFGVHLLQTSSTRDGRRLRYTPAAWIAVSPFTAKRLTATLGEAVRNYEGQFGTIELDTSKRLKRR